MGLEGTWVRKLDSFVRNMSRPSCIRVTLYLSVLCIVLKGRFSEIEFKNMVDITHCHGTHNRKQFLQVI